MAWIPIAGTKYFSKDGKGVYEKLGGKTSDGLYLRISPSMRAKSLIFTALMITSPRFVIPQSHQTSKRNITLVISGRNVVFYHLLCPRHPLGCDEGFSYTKHYTIDTAEE